MGVDLIAVRCLSVADELLACSLIVVRVDGNVIRGMSLLQWSTDITLWFGGVVTFHHRLAYLLYSVI